MTASAAGPVDGCPDTDAAAAVNTAATNHGVRMAAVYAFTAGGREYKGRLNGKNLEIK